ADPIDVQIIGSTDDALQKIPGSGAIIGAKDVARAQANTMGELARRVPGVRVREEEGAGLRLNIGVRGLDPTRSRRVLLLEDGVPIAINPYGEPDAYYSTPVERIRAIEVVKGSGSILFGPQSVGGVINFLTLSAPSEATVTIDGQLGERLFRRTLVRYGDTVGDTRFVVQAMYKGSEGIRGMSFDVGDFFGKVSFPTSQRGEATVKLSVYSESSGATYVGLTDWMYREDPRRPTLSPDDRFNVHRYDATITHEQQFSSNTKLRTIVFGHITDRVWRRQNYYRPKTDAEVSACPRLEGDPTLSNGTICFIDRSTLRDRKYDVFGVEPVLNTRFETAGVRHTLTLGTRYMTEGSRRRQYVTQTVKSDSGDLADDESHRTHAFAAYAQDRIAFRDWLLLTPGLRLEHADFDRVIGRTSVNGTPTDVGIEGQSSSTSLLPGLGIVLGTPKLNAFAGFYQGFAPPRVSTAITNEGRDAQLGAEQSTNYELGVRAAPARWARVEATLFMMNFQNQLVSGTLASGDESEYVNGGATRHFGGEAAATVKIAKAAKLPFDL
ncbi:MAG: TonB-dependent receptor, partial [Polyangiaceae bacterium]